MSVERVIVSAIALFAQALAVTLIVFKQIKNCKKSQIIAFYLVVWLYCLVSCYLIPNQFRFLLFVTVIAIAMFLILKIRNKNVVLYSFNTEVIMAISEVVITSVLVLFGVDSTDIVNNPLWNLVTNVLISFTAIAIINISFIKKIVLLINEKFCKNKKLINYLYIFLAILYLIVSKNGLELILKSNYYINILFVAGAVFILTIIIKNEFKYEQINEQNKQMLNYVTKYEKIITEQGKANHEFKNQLMVIRGYAQMNSPKLIEYLDSVVEDANKTQSSYLISQLNKFPDGGIKGLLYYKLSLMDDFKIKYDINVESGVKTKLNSLSTNMYKNITKILGVLLDNAIDASKQAKNKKIVISVIKEKSNVIFKIYNTYKGKIDISKIGTGHTTKGKGHGYGLRLVKDIIENNKGFKMKNELDNEYYVCMLSVKTINKRKK